MKKYTFSTSITKRDSNLSWTHLIEVPFNICAQLIENGSEGNKKRVFCEVNKKVKYQCALMPNGNGTHVIMFSKTNRKKADIEHILEFEVCLWNDVSEYGIEFPIEMKEVLAQDDLGNDFFQKLTPGKQRSLIHLVNKPKSEALRIEKTFVILEHLKRNKGKLDMRMLHEDFKIGF